MTTHELDFCLPTVWLHDRLFEVANRLGRVGVQWWGCIGGFLCLVSDFKMVKGTYLLSIVGSLQLGFTTCFLPPKFFGTFFHPLLGRRDGPQLRFTHQSYPSSDSTMLSERDFWLATIFVPNPPNRKFQPCRGTRDVEFSSFVPALDMSDFSTKHSQSLKNFQIFGARKPKQPRNFSTKIPEKIPTLNQRCLWFGIRVSYGMRAKSRGHLGFPGHPDGLCVGVTLTHPQETEAVE